MRVRIIGVGPGDPDQITLEGLRAIRSVAFFVVSDKSAQGGMPDPLVEAVGAKTAKGRLVVSDDLQVPGCPDVFACGDAAAVPDIAESVRLLVAGQTSHASSARAT